MKKILFITELSSNSGQQFQYALALGKAFGASVIIGHGYGWPESALETKLEAEKESELLEKLQGFATSNTSEKFRQVPVEFDVALAYPADAILQLSQKHQADLIIMSLFGNTDLHFRDTTAQVLKKAIVPVLALAEDEPFQGFDRMIFATDFQFNDLIALNTLQRWATAFGSSIRVIHAVEKASERPRAMEKMEAMRNTLKPYANISFELLEGGKPRDLILEKVAAEDAQLLCMTTHRHSGLWHLVAGSTTRKVAREVSVPLLLVKDEDDIRGQET